MKGQWASIKWDQLESMIWIEVRIHSSAKTKLLVSDPENSLYLRDQAFKIHLIQITSMALFLPFCDYY